VLLISEDLDELMELADRLCVMFDGAVVHETAPSLTDVAASAAAWRGTHSAAPEAQRPAARLFFGSVAPARELEIHRVSPRARAGPHEAEALRDRPVVAPREQH